MSEDPRTNGVPRWGWYAIALVLVVVLGGLTWLLTRPSEPTVAPPAPPTEVASASVAPSSAAAPSPTPSPSQTPSPVSSSVPPSATPASATPSPTPTYEGLRAECQPHTGQGFVPERFVFERPSADGRVLSLGLAADGTIAAPPADQPTTASWWNQGPQPGSSQGKVVLSIHTYRRGGALGNAMYDGGTSQLQPGDLIALYGPDGQVACYEFEEAVKVWVDDYDPDSDVMVDFAGDPTLTMIICWDFERATEFWASRVFFYATPWSP